MKRHFSFTVLAFFVFWAASVVAARAENGVCTIQGSFISYDDNGVPTWMSSAYGQSTSSGANELEYPAEFPTLQTPEGPIFPNAVGMTLFRGAWERTGGHTFKYTFIGYAYDANRVPVWIGRMSGPLTLSKDCNTMEVGATLYVFECDSNGKCPNPYGETTKYQFDIPTSYGYRVTVE